MVDGEPAESTGSAGGDEPSLELPSLGWRRKRRRAAEAPADDPVSTETTAPLEPVSPAEPTGPIEPVESPAPVQPAPATAELTIEPDLVDEHDPVPVTAPAPETKPRRERTPRGPGGMPAAVLTGLVVGLGIVGLTWASLRLCESVQGTSSCGKAGYGLLIAILAVMIVVGALLLRLARVPEAASTSFLAVGLTAVLALVFLVDSLMDRPMVVVIPLISAGTFALAHWVTRTFSGSSSPVE